jgi:hypothetical protein
VLGGGSAPPSKLETLRLQLGFHLGQGKIHARDSAEITRKVNLYQSDVISVAEMRSQ